MHYRISNSDAVQIFTILEDSPTDKLNRLLDNYSRQTATSMKCILSYTCHQIGYGDFDQTAKTFD